MDIIKIALLLLTPFFAHAFQSLLDAAPSPQKRALEKAGINSLDLGHNQEAETSRTALTLIVSVASLLSVFLLCLSTTCIVEHVSLFTSGQALSEGTKSFP